MVVLGGGPAGSLVAALVRRQAPGKTVLILEREHFPRPHVGEVTLPGWGPILERAGALQKVDEAMAIQKVGVTFAWGPAEAGRTWTADFREPDGAPLPSAWHLQRDVFDEVLLRNAAEHGADVIEGARVSAVSPLDGDPLDFDHAPSGYRVDWVDADGEQACEADHVVDATGQTRLLTRQFGLPTRRHDDMNNYALYGYWRGSETFHQEFLRGERERWTFIATSDDGWFWHIPVAPDVTSVGLVTRQEVLREVGKDGLLDLYRRNIASSEVAPLLTDATFLGRTRSGDDGELNVVSDWSYRVERVAGPGWFLVGDAALFVDPVLSSGLTLVSNGASMVANALCTQWAGGDARLLATSYEESIADLGSAYLNMARVWYARNLRRDTWFWTARRQQLRGEGLWQTDGDAFGAMSVGAVTNPLEAAIVDDREDLWGVEFFSWISAHHLFAGQDWKDFDGVADAGAARVAATRKMLDRWRQLSRSRVRVRRDDHVVREGYWTSAFLDHWKRIAFVELPGDERIVFPRLDTAPEGIFPLLDGRTAGEAVRAGVGAPGGDARERDRHARVLAESILRLDLLGLLEVDEEPAPLPGGNHPWFAVLLASALAVLDEPARVEATVDWLGEGCRQLIHMPDCEFHVHLLDSSAAPEAQRMRSETTAVSFHRPPGRDAWAQGYVERLVARLRKQESAGLWSSVRELPGFSVALHHTPGQRPRAERL